MEDLEYVNTLTNLTSENYCIITQEFDNKLHCTDAAVACYRSGIFHLHAVVPIRQCLCI